MKLFRVLLSLFSFLIISKAKFTIQSDIDSISFVELLTVGWSSSISVVEQNFVENTYHLCTTTVSPPSIEDRITNNQTMIPLFGSPVYVLVNGLAKDFVLNILILAQIYNGLISYWDDPQIKAINLGIEIPHEQIKVFLPKSTKLFDSLSITFSLAMQKEFGVDFVLDWSIIDSSSSYADMQNTLLREPYSIGLSVRYVSIWWWKVRIVPLINVQGEVEPSQLTVNIGFMEHWQRYDSPLASLDYDNLNGYPLIVIHYAVIPSDFSSSDIDVADIKDIRGFLKSVLDDGSGRDMLRGVFCAPMSRVYSYLYYEKLVAAITYDGQSIEDEIASGMRIAGNADIYIQAVAESFYRHVFAPSEIADLEYLFFSTENILEKILNFEIDAGVIPRSTLERRGKSSNFSYLPLAKVITQVVVNLPIDDKNKKLILKPRTLEMLMAGCFEFWDDELLIDGNEDLNLPHLKVTIFDIGSFFGVYTTPNGLICPDQIKKSEIKSVPIPFDEEIDLCEVPGAVVYRNERGDPIDNVACDNDYTTLIVVLTQTSNGNIIYPQFNYVDNCGIEDKDWESVVNEDQCWPIFAVIEFLLARDQVKSTNVINTNDYLYDHLATYTTQCDILKVYVLSAYYFFLDKQQIQNMEVLGVHPPNFEELEIAADELKTLNCNGESFFETDNDTLEKVFIIASIAFFVIILISSLTITILSTHNHQQKIAQERLQRALEVDRTRLDESSRMTAWVNHEIRNILNGILGLSMFARDSMKEASKQSTLRQTRELIAHATTDVNTVVQSCELLSIITNDVMKLRQLEEGKLTSIKTPTNLYKLVNTVMKVFRPKFNEKPAVKVRLNLFSNAAMEEYLLDAVHIMQVLVNFVGNAQKFTDEGLIRITVLKKDNNRIRFEVHDTGIGVPTELHSSIFEQRWVQGDTKERAKGSGFGLYLCKGLVTKVMNGTVGFTSVPRIGSTFFFEVPIGDNASTINEIEESSSCGGLGALETQSSTYSDGGSRKYPENSFQQTYLSQQCKSMDNDLQDVQERRRKSIVKEFVNHCNDDDGEEDRHRSSVLCKVKQNDYPASASSSFCFKDKPCTPGKACLHNHTLKAGENRAAKMSILQYGVGISHHDNSHSNPSQPNGLFTNTNTNTNREITSDFSMKATSRKVVPLIINSPKRQRASIHNNSNQQVVFSTIDSGTLSPSRRSTTTSSSTQGLDSRFSRLSHSTCEDHIAENDNRIQESLVELFSGKVDDESGESLFEGNNMVNSKGELSNTSKTSSFNFPSVADRYPQSGIKDSKESSRSFLRPLSARNKKSTSYSSLNSARSISTNNKSNQLSAAVNSDTYNAKKGFNSITSTNNPTYAYGSTNSNSNGDFSSLLRPTTGNRKATILDGCTILVVDDSPVNRLILRRCLSRAGATIIEAGDGKVAIEAWKSTEKVDMIWMDVVMPSMNGLDATKELRSAGCNCAIIACTGNVQEQDHRKCISAGMNRLEGKPLNPHRALKVTQSFIGFEHSPSMNHQ